MIPILETHLFRDERGIVCVDTPRNKVKMLVPMVQDYGGIEQTVAALPHLTRAQLHAAMCYYYDHQTEIDEEIRKDKEFVEQFRLSNPEPPVASRVREIMKARHPELF
jgi:uncharacterized protein (DUF433 family)